MAFCICIVRKLSLLFSLERRGQPLFAGSSQLPEDGEFVIGLVGPELESTSCKG